MSTNEILKAVGVEAGTLISSMTAETFVDLVIQAAGGAKPEWMTPEQAEAYTGRSRRTIEGWGQRGLVEVKRRGVDSGRACNLYRTASLDAHLDRS